jgi:hypothetical protein
MTRADNGGQVTSTTKSDQLASVIANGIFDMIDTTGRRLVWNGEFQQWSCSECAWLFEPAGLFADKSLNQYFDLVRRDQEFASHLCANHQKHTKAAETG